MSRYIDVNEFYDKMYEWVRMHGGIIRNEMRAILEAVSYIDIVRCKECKYKDTFKCWMRNTQVPRYPSADDFCSYGSYGEREGE